MQRLSIGTGALAFTWIVGEHGAIRSLWGQAGIVARLFGLHSGVQAGSVSRTWLRQYDAERDKRGDEY